MATYIQVLTDQGRNMVADADAGMTLTFDRVELGSGVINPALIPGMIALPPVSEMDATISGPPMRNQPFQVTIPATIVPADIRRGFFMNAIGVWGTINGINSRLYSVGYPVLDDGVTVGTGDFVGMPTGASVTEHYLRIATAVNRAIDVECLFDPLAVEVYVANVDEDVGGIPIPPADLGAGVWSRRGTSPGGQAGSGYLLKRLKMGPNIEIEEDADTITIGVKTLKVSLNLYVPSTFPPANMQPGDVGIPGETLFDSIQAAHDYLLQFTIPSGVSANIYHDAGVYNLTNTVFFSHPNSSRINLFGAPVTSRVVTSVSGNNANGQVNLTGPDMTGVGAWIGSFLFRAGGPNNFQDPVLASGIFPINGINPTTVTYLTFGGFAVDGVMVGTTGRLDPYLTILEFSGGVSGFNFPNGIGVLQGFAIINEGGNAPSSISGISIGSGSSASIRYVGLAKWSDVNGTSYGLICSGNLTIDECTIGHSDNALTITGSGNTSVNNCILHNSQYTGLYVYQAKASLGGGFAYCVRNGLANTSGSAGILVSNGGSLIADAFWVVANQPAGLWALVNGTITYSGANLKTCFNSYGTNSFDCRMACLSTIYRGGGSVMNYGNANIAPNVLSVDGCVFQP